MSFHGIRAIRHLQAHMGYNQKAIQLSADNLGRHAIPGEKTKELAPYSFTTYIGAQNPATLRMTNARHIAVHQAYGHSRISSKRSPGEISASGNDIVPEQELQKMNEAALNINEDIKAYENILSNYKAFTMMGK
jgi:flagellar basal body rod protein FlgB